MYSWLIYGNFWIAFGAIGITCTSSFIMYDQVDIKVLIIVFLATILGYNYQCYISAIYSNKQYEKDKWILSRVMSLKIISALSLLGCIILVFYTFNLIEIACFLPFGFITLCYRWPLLGKALRDVPYIKIFLISITWGFVSVMLPSFSMHDLSNLNWQLIFVNSIYIFCITIPFDIRDLKHDDISQKTLPQIYGVKTSVLIACLGLIFVGIFYFKIEYYGLMIHSLVSIIIVSMSLKKKEDWYYSFIIDGLLILFPIFILI